jgi:hypothetical protein
MVSYCHWVMNMIFATLGNGQNNRPKSKKAFDN